MLVKFRFIERLAAVTPVYNALLAVNDRMTDVFAKLQGLLSVRNNRSIRTSATTVGTSSTADFSVGSLVIPGNDIQVNDVISFFVLGDWTKPNSGANSVRMWVKVNGTLAGQITFTTSNSVSDRPISFHGKLVVRSKSASGQIAGGLNAVISAATAFSALSTQGDFVTVDTLSDVTISVGVGFGTSNASNRVTAEIVNIIQE